MTEVTKKRLQVAGVALGLTLALLVLVLKLNDRGPKTHALTVAIPLVVGDRVEYKAKGQRACESMVQGLAEDGRVLVTACGSAERVAVDRSELRAKSYAYEAVEAGDVLIHKDQQRVEVLAADGEKRVRVRGLADGAERVAPRMDFMLVQKKPAR